MTEEKKDPIEAAVIEAVGDVLGQPVKVEPGPHGIKTIEPDGWAWDEECPHEPKCPDRTCPRPKKIPRTNEAASLNAFDLLRRLNESVPSPDGQRHHLSFIEGRRAVVLMLEGEWRSFFIDDEDLARPAEDVARDIVSMLGTVDPRPSDALPFRVGDPVRIRPEAYWCAEDARGVYGVVSQVGRVSIEVDAPNFKAWFDPESVENLRSAEDLDDPKKRRLPPLVSALGPLDMAEAHVRSALDGDDVDENLAEALEQIQHARREHDDLRGRVLPTIDRGRLSEEELDRIERHIRSARHAEDIWTTPADALAMIAEIRDRRRERATPDAEVIGLLATTLKKVLDDHDGYHCDSCEDRQGGPYSDDEYDHPAHRPEERDCDCGDVGRRNAARKVLASLSSSNEPEKP